MSDNGSPSPTTTASIRTYDQARAAGSDYPLYHIVRQSSSYSDPERLPYIYGFDVESGEVNVFTLTPALESFSRSSVDTQNRSCS
jgi:hypothetical protein